MHELILASTSPARRMLLDALGLPFWTEAPGVDEEVAPGLSVESAVIELARRKAQAVSGRHPGTRVLGADQMIDVDGQRLGKPPDRDAARAQLQQLSGRIHTLRTAVCLTDGARLWEGMETARLQLYPLTALELERYLDLEEWKGCAGAYRVEGRGQALMARIEGDRTNIQGLPMVTVVRLLREAGVDLLSSSAPQ